MKRNVKLYIYIYRSFTKTTEQEYMHVGENDNETISYTNEKKFVPGVEDEALAENSLGITRTHKTEGRCTCCDHN